jgi:hypothetical protein
VTFCFCCAGAPPDRPASPPIGSDPWGIVDTDSDEPALPPGVLARADGIHGAIQVEERDGLRLLTIDGEIQGAIRIDGGDRLDGDPVVGLIRALRPAASTALVIGLGTGRTAFDLIDAGLEIEVAEIEPHVVEFAREHFSYMGPAEVADGLEYLENAGGPFDVILIDAGAWPPGHLIDSEARRLLRERLTEAGVLAFRLRAAPSDPRVTELFYGFPHMFRDLFGSGIGDEEQNLYLVWSAAPLTLVDPPGALAAWPVQLPHETASPLEQADSREVTLVGYLVRDAATGTLVLDLPHWEMGAMRYVLGGADLEELERALPSEAEFPTEGDIRSDGDTSKTMKIAAGGGGCKRSDVRFSPVIAAIEGTVSFRATQDPDAAFFGPREYSDEPAIPLLPYGGVLYDLRIDRLLWTLDRRAWDRLRKKKLARPARRASKAIARGDLATAGEHLDDYVAAIDAALGDPARLLLIRAEMARVASALRGSASSVPEACRRAVESLRGDEYSLPEPAYLEIREALWKCAGE